MIEVSQLTIEFFTSVAVGGDAGLRSRGTATLAAVATRGSMVVSADVVAENAVPPNFEEDANDDRELHHGPRRVNSDVI